MSFDAIDPDVSKRQGCTRMGQYVVLLLVVLAVGCSGDDGRTAAVSGTVTLDGDPVLHGTILFASEDGRAAGAELQNGTFSLTIQPGEFLVSVSPPQPADPGAPLPEGSVDIPPKYQNFMTSGLVAEVQQGDNTVDFEMSSR